MARREYTIELTCAEPGCREHSFAVAETRQEERDARARYAKHPYRCVRHMSPGEVLSAEEPNRSITLTVIEVHRKDYRGEDYVLGLYWGRDAESAHHGFVYGDGYKAFARDFPIGTRLTINVAIELPGGSDEQ